MFEFLCKTNLIIWYTKLGIFYWKIEKYFGKKSITDYLLVKGIELKEFLPTKLSEAQNKNLNFFLIMPTNNFLIKEITLLGINKKLQIAKILQNKINYYFREDICQWNFIFNSQSKNCMCVTIIAGKASALHKYAALFENQNFSVTIQPEILYLVRYLSDKNTLAAPYSVLLFYDDHVVLAGVDKNNFIFLQLINQSFLQLNLINLQHEFKLLLGKYNFHPKKIYSNKTELIANLPLATDVIIQSISLTPQTETDKIIAFDWYPSLFSM